MVMSFIDVLMDIILSRSLLLLYYFVYYYYYYNNFIEHYVFYQQKSQVATCVSVRFLSKCNACMQIVDANWIARTELIYISTSM